MRIKCDVCGVNDALLNRKLCVPTTSDAKSNFHVCLKCGNKVHSIVSDMIGKQRLSSYNKYGGI